MITQEHLKKLVHYDPETGVFIWLVDRGDKIKAGDIAGGSNLSSGYKRLCIDYKSYLQHRLAFLYMEGNLPKVFVDHINGNRSDNRWCNLRHATKLENARNCAARSDNTSGTTGVWQPKGRKKWVVQFRNKHIGYCDTLDQAKQLYEIHAKETYAEFYKKAHMM